MSETTPQGTPAADGGSFWIAKLGIAVCVALAVAFLIKPVRAHLDRSKGVEAATRAVALAGTNRFDEAMIAMQSALQLAPSTLEVQKAAADVLTRLGDPRALSFWAALIQGGHATAEERRRFVELALQTGHPEVAGGELSKLLIDDPKSPQLRILQIKLKAMTDDVNEAVSLAEAWFQQNPVDDAAQFAAGWIRSRFSNPTQKADGRRLLVAVGSGTSAWQREAIDTLADDSELNRGEVQIVLKSLESRPAKTLQDTLRIADLKLRLDSSKRAEIIQDLVVRSRALDASQLVPLSNWLEVHEALTAVPLAVPMERARTNSGLLMLRLQTLAWLGKTEEVEPALRDETLPLEPLQRQILKVTIGARRTPPVDPAPALAEAMKHAGTNVAMIASIASHTLRLGYTNNAIDIYATLLSNPAQVPVVSAEIVRLVESYASTRVVRDKLRELMLKNPEPSLFSAEASYFDLLLGENIQDARKHLELFKGRAGESMRIKLSLALADLRSNNAASAARYLEGDTTNWSRVPPRWQAVHAAILGASGNTNAAKAAAKAIDKSKLRPEEVELIRRWL